MPVIPALLELTPRSKSMSLPSIGLVDAGGESSLPGDTMAAHAVAVPKEVERFEGQVVVFLDELLSDHDLGSHLRIRSQRGESVTVAADEVAGYSLLSTNTPSWKLVPAGRSRLHEITGPRFLLRDVASIELQAAGADEAVSDEVFTNLTDALMRPAAVRFLNLTSARLETFPAGIFEFQRLESLNLGKNRLAAIPPEIGTLRHLKSLKLSRNELATLPEEIGRLKQLVELHVSRNQIESLPEKFWNLDRLELLNLGSNRLTSIPESIASLTSLRELELAENPIPKSDRPQIEQWLPNVTVEW
ncbi:MAG: leucine-rich repeat domain-containing protein [Pirellulales bacterium]